MLLTGETTCARATWAWALSTTPNLKTHLERRGGVLGRIACVCAVFWDGGCGGVEDGGVKFMAARGDDAIATLAGLRCRCSDHRPRQRAPRAQIISANLDAHGQQKGRREASPAERGAKKGAKSGQHEKGPALQSKAPQVPIRSNQVKSS